MNRAIPLWASASVVLALASLPGACASKGKSRSAPSNAGAKQESNTNTSADAQAGGGGDGAATTHDPTATGDGEAGAGTGTNTNTNTGTNTSGGGESDTPTDGQVRTWEECIQANKAWRPAPAPARCGQGALVNWPCCKEQIMARFALAKDSLEESFTKSAGFTLYACEALPDGNTRIHWKKDITNGISYRWTTIPKEAMASANPTATCAIPPVTPPKSTGTGTGTGTSMDEDSGVDINAVGP